VPDGVSDVVEPRIAVAVVTMGNRPAEVDALLESVAKQDLPPTRIVIVGNGCRLPEFADRLSLPGEVTTIDLDENLGCPGGRNVGLARLRAFGDVDVVVELDDDGLLVDADVLRRVRDLYAADPASASSASGSPTSTGRPSGAMCRGSARGTRWRAGTSPGSSAAGTR
jgi:GT2 family glycosyltransferase